MATISRKRKSPEPSEPHAPDHNVDATAALRTPIGSPVRKKMRITHSQKLALIDNLQLEVTERARKLRAQYALQAQDLRARIERRINRIPVALRKAKMGDLLAKYSQTTKVDDVGKKSGTTTSSKSSSKAGEEAATTSSAGGNNAASTTRTTRGVKRTSDQMLASDKENAPLQAQDHHHHQHPVHVPLSNPKKRGTPNAHPAGHHPRVLSQFTETGVLSPKSSNSRTFPQSPLRNVTGKSQQQLGGSVRPSSPLKHASPIKSARAAGTVENAKTRSTRGATGTGTRKVSPAGDGTGTRRRTTAKSTASTTSKRAAPPSRPTTRQRNTRRNSGDSTISNLSSGTTIVKATTRGAPGSQKGPGTRAASSAATAANKKPPAAARGVRAPTATSAAKKTTASAAAGSAVKAIEPAAASGTRVLRKRA
ncbi:hypothetical protein AJ78_02483 [Emergomyces pasteurianus Ep9510]|uniref:Borealin N-terminal domain-containing protein n=1 Tax=Emergomyces pasteurianus Ep9510 TaxID=1447872 RepID=A0A1J9QAZ5_9EURO|nr:hypothetical protein AJ78_02483 [Emergomyces pasteurianus Ep9510]